MAGHYGVDAGRDGRLEGNQFHLVQPLARCAYTSEVHMRVGVGVAMAGKVLGRHEHLIGWIGVRSLDESLHVRGDGLRVLAEGADVDDRVVGIVVDVGVGREDPMNAHRACLARRGRAESTRQFKVVRGPEGHHVGERRRANHAHGRAVLEIGADDQRRLGQTLHPVQEGGGGVWLGTLNCAVADLVQHDQPANFQIDYLRPVLAILARPHAGGIAIAGGHDELRDTVAQGHLRHPPARLCGRGPRLGGCPSGFGRGSRARLLPGRCGVQPGRTDQQPCSQAQRASEP